MMRWISKIVGTFAFSKGLLDWDSYEVFDGSIKNLLKEMNTESVIEPGRCTKYIQVPDVAWSKSFRLEFYGTPLHRGR